MSSFSPASGLRFGCFLLGAALGVPALLSATAVLPACDVEVGSEGNGYPIWRTEALLLLLKRAATRVKPFRLEMSGRTAAAHDCGVS